MRRLLVSALLLSALLALMAPSANADIEGECEAYINDEPVAGRSGINAKESFVVARNGTVNLTISTQQPVNAFLIELEYGFSRFTMHDQEFPVPVPVTNQSGAFEVSEFAKYGAGVYRVITTVEMDSGAPCIITALVHVDGNPLTTWAGAVAMGAAVLGLAGLIQSAVGGFQQVKEVKDSVQDFRAAARAVREAGKGRL